MIVLFTIIYIPLAIYGFVWIVKEFVKALSRETDNQPKA